MTVVPRRSGSEASRVEWMRMATRASWSGARASAWAWTSPVATVATPSRWPACPAAGCEPYRPAGRSLELDPQRSGPKTSRSRQAWARRGPPAARIRSGTPDRRHGPGTVLKRYLGASRAVRAGLARARVRAGEDAAQVGPPAGVLHQKGEVPHRACRKLGHPARGRSRLRGSGRSPNARAHTANSIEPETVLWSVSAIAP